ncbi:MAG: LutC/YkgG family protein [Candidatus Promineifilaceae bacterium]
MERNAFLNKISAKIGKALLPDAEVTHPGAFTDYSWNPQTPQDELVAQFKHELEALTGHVYLLDDVEDSAETILQILAKHNTKHIIAWGNDDLGLPNLREILGESGVTIDDNHLPTDEAGRKAQLAKSDEVYIGLTGANGGLADNGAIGIVSGKGRGRLASLSPPVHIALLRRDQIYPSIPAFLADHDGVTADASNLVFIAGPSRTGDIEMTLSIGVHGPGETHVIVLP